MKSTKRKTRMVTYLDEQFKSQIHNLVDMLQAVGYNTSSSELIQEAIFHGLREVQKETLARVRNKLLNKK